MNNDRPISEHEGALFDVVRVLAATLIDLGADPELMRQRLTATRDATEALGNRHGAATITFLIASLFPSPEGPQQPPSKPTLRVV